MKHQDVKYQAKFRYSTTKQSCMRIRKMLDRRACLHRVDFSIKRFFVATLFDSPRGRFDITILSPARVVSNCLLFCTSVHFL